MFSRSYETRVYFPEIVAILPEIWWALRLVILVTTMRLRFKFRSAFVPITIDDASDVCALLLAAASEFKLELFVLCND